MQTSNDLLEMSEDIVEIIRKSHGYLSSSDINEAIDELDQWIKRQNHFTNKDFSHRYLENMLISSKGSMKKSQERLESLCTYKTKTPHFFGDYNPKTDFKEFDGIMNYMYKTVYISPPQCLNVQPTIEEISQESKIALLPKLSKNNCRVWVLKNSGKKFKSDCILQFIRLYVLCIEYIREYDYSDGKIIVVDMRDANLFEIMRRISFNQIRQIAAIAIEGYGTRVQGIHFISSSRLIGGLIWLTKQVISAKLGGRIECHTSHDTLHNFLPRKILPVDYDGEEISLSSLHDALIERLSTEEVREHNREMSKAGTDESRRQSNNNYIENLRTLDID